MCWQNYDSEDCGHDEEGEPGLDRSPAADVLAMDQHQDGQSDHVPAGAVLVTHDVQGPGHVGMTVVTEEVVHPALHNSDLRDFHH